MASVRGSDGAANKERPVSRSVQLSVMVAIWTAANAAAISGLQFLSPGLARTALLVASFVTAIGVCWATLRAMPEAIHAPFWRAVARTCVIAAMLAMTTLYIFIASMQLR